MLFLFCFVVTLWFLLVFYYSINRRPYIDAVATGIPIHEFIKYDITNATWDLYLVLGLDNQEYYIC